MQSLLNFSGRRHLPILRQTEAAECGLACLAMIASYHGHQIDLNTLRRRYPISLKGATLRALVQVANHLNLACRPLRFELRHLRQLRLPAIVHWDMNHFVVLKSVTNQEILVHDPALGAKSYPVVEASKHLTGIALELSPTETFSFKDEGRGCHSQASGETYRAPLTPSRKSSRCQPFFKFLFSPAPSICRLSLTR